MKSNKLNFYLTYGNKSNKNIDKILTDLVSILDVEFEKRSSDYFGEYYKCSGMSFDKLNVYENNEDLLQFPNEYKSVIDLSIINGKNNDRRSKYSFNKKAFQKLNDLELFKDKLIED